MTVTTYDVFLSIIYPNDKVMDTLIKRNVLHFQKIIINLQQLRQQYKLSQHHVLVAAGTVAISLNIKSNKTGTCEEYKYLEFILPKSVRALLGNMSVIFEIKTKL